MINWTQKMKDELLYTKNPTVIAKRYKIGYETARRKLMELLGVTSLREYTDKKEIKIKEEKSISKQEEIKEITTKILNKQEDTIIDNIKKVIIDIDALKNKGINFYLTDSRKEIGNYDKQISDYRHALENSLETLNETELAQISRNIGLLSRKRRLYKNETDFLDNHRTETQNFLDFLKKIDEEVTKINNKTYSTRILKDNMESVVITSKHNDTIKDLENENTILKNKIKELERTPNSILPDEIKERLYNLEKFNLKENRKRQRDRGQIVAIDCLKQNWKELFNTELDELTRNGIINDCYAKYSGINVKEIRDLDVWGRIIPEYLCEKKYFLKEDDEN